MTERRWRLPNHFAPSRLSVRREERLDSGAGRYSGERIRLGESSRAISASRRKAVFGETPNTTRGDAYAPQTFQSATTRDDDDQIWGPGQPRELLQ